MLKPRMKNFLAYGISIPVVEFTDETWKKFSSEIVELSTKEIISPEDVSLDLHYEGYIAYVEVSGTMLYSGTFQKTETLAGESLRQTLTETK